MVTDSLSVSLTCREACHLVAGMWEGGASSDGRDVRRFGGRGRGRGTVMGVVSAPSAPAV